MTSEFKTMTFEDYNEPTEEKQWKVGALIQCEEITYKAAVTPIIDAWKQAMFEETGEDAYADYCGACDTGTDHGHTYNPKYCCVADDYHRNYEGNYPPDY